ncbi:DUF2306 domain-containing protein [Marimonas sp. MJW-29]|uniref:DUF2306 domain-containing protein n=1 Tax=Sulfitobacter sediminis TaxID=3234186 RepID=A0ABV3RM58_9RHOB
MNWAALWAEGFPIPAHALAAVGALGIGTVQLLTPKGTTVHRVLGRAWVLAMGFVAVSSFIIYELRLIGPFSPIHLLSIYTIGSLFVGVRAARRGNISLHRATMRSLYWLALVVAGLFTLLPGRVMHSVVFGV